VTTDVTVGSARRAAVGQSVCGDACAVFSTTQGTLICVADGLGHGADANAAASLACEYARQHADVPLETLMRGMDRVLAGTRGAAVSLISLRPAAALVQYVGIGNVDLRAIARAPIAPPSTPGIMGRGLRKVRVWEYPLATEDLLVIVTDGISSRFELGAFSHLAPQALAETLVAKHHKAHDDACCVVARIGSA
jgi:negative regulator of sigma-B (phosphoserine phosphatase)